MHSKRLSAFAATILSVAAFAAFNPPQYTDTYTSGGVTYAQLGGVKSSNYVATAVSFGVASNYVDAVASEFEDGTRTVSRAISAGDASTAETSYYLAGDSWADQYNADDLIRASTNAALAVSGTLEWRLTNGYLKVASAMNADAANTADTAQNAANVAWDENGNYMSGSEIYARVIEDMPSPGNYSAVSNAAMNARSMTDLAVRGSPQGEGSYFLVNGEIAIWIGGHEDPDDDGWYGAVHISPLAGGYYGFNTGSAYTNFMLQGEGYTATLNLGGETYHVQGFRGTLAQVSQIPDVSGYTTQQQATNAAIAVADTKISTNNAAFVSAVLAVPLTGADAGDLAEIAEYGGYGTVGAAVLALIAGLAALKRRVTSAETALAQKASLTDLPYALVTPGEWAFSDGGTYTVTGPREVTFESASEWVYETAGDGVTYYSQSFSTEGDALSALSLTFTHSSVVITATRASLPGHLCDRAGNRVEVSGDTTLTLPAANPGYLRDFLVRLTVSASSAITFSAQTGETITWDAMGDPSATFAAGTYLYRFTEVAQGVFHAEDMLALVGLEAALAAINGGVAP